MMMMMIIIIIKIPVPCVGKFSSIFHFTCYFLLLRMDVFGSSRDPPQQEKEEEGVGEERWVTRQKRLEWRLYGEYM